MSGSAQLRGSGAIILARHGEPALSRHVRLTSADYRRWWADYEEGGLKGGQAPPSPLAALAARADVVLTSTRRRAIESAEALAPGRACSREPSLIEAPLPPPALPRFVRLSPRVWGFLARLWWWFFDHHLGEERRVTAEARAEQEAKRLISLAEGGREVLVVAHGFFNSMIGRALKRNGWRCVDDQGYRYWCARRFEPCR